ncbi:sensor protein FixL [Clostridium ragsdalei P11]|uniref:histidine kinase n=1 Tax=Clostridium ragsdalei P11 TaxID=1353534 RepID=A0A1A6ASA5_9CLOT|nr:ATP-binding protein [Clostridium ragsdalei]OBR92961.1 sensor protein FixL [Clostridium ragsdalei P11]
MNESISFRPRARLMAQLGEQLIKDENIAVLELIKNSYDADAKEVKVTMKNLESPDQGVIIIEDNGDGMSFDIVKNCWMEPGTDNKEKKLEKMIKNNIRSKLNRLPMGEKGIGRFGVHKLGSKITLITRAENQKEVYIEIDWTIFNSSKYLSEIPIRIIERDSNEKFLGESLKGTKIIIEKLKVKWSRGKVRSLYRSINSLNSPFKSIDSFNIIFDIDNKDWIKGLVKYEDIKDYALFKCTMTLSGDKIKDYRYEFIPWKSMNKLEYRNNFETGIDMFETVRKMGNNGKTRRGNESIDLCKFKIGDVKIELLSFDLDTKILNMSVKDIQGLKTYLTANGGIFVYRDNIKIYEAGENDWLGLGAHRVNAPGDKISNNLVLGSVNIDRKDSGDLKEKTNREGFIEDAAYGIFRKAVLFAVGKFERDRALDKQLLRKYYGATSKSEPVIAAVSEVREKVENKISDKKLKKEILGCLNNIEKDYKHITDIYQKSSSAGLSMNVVLHEIDKIISELEYAIIAENTSEHIKMLVKRLEILTDGYSSVMKSKSIKILNLKKIIKQSLFMVDFRLQAHEIKVMEEYMNNDQIFKAKGNDNLIASIIVNIIDNSIWWLNFAKVKNKKIYFDITKDIPGYISIIIADNGKGFTIPTEMATKPFITDKPGGMGLGLHLASELMKQHGGNLLFPQFDDLQLPCEFGQGAIVALAFKEE